MKLTAILLLIPTLALAQTATKPKSATALVKPNGAAAASARGCVNESGLSPKIPALPASAPCAKHLFTITSIPTVKLENVSPMEGTDLAERLGIGSNSVSLDYVETKVGTTPSTTPATSPTAPSSTPQPSRARPTPSSTATTKSSADGISASTACASAASAVSSSPGSSPTGPTAAHPKSPPGPNSSSTSNS
jgi:hypothetical protein